MTRGRKAYLRAFSTGGKPAPPAWLNDAARAHWDHVVSALAEAGFLSAADADTLATYCTLYTEFVECAERLEAEGAVTDGRLSPWAVRQAALVPLLLRLARELGLTPTARSKIAVPRPGAESDQSGLLNVR